MNAWIQGLLKLAPRGTVGTIGYCLVLLAGATQAVGMAIRDGTLPLIECSPSALAAMAQWVAVGQLAAGGLVIVVAVGLGRATPGAP